MKVKIASTLVCSTLCVASYSSTIYGLASNGGIFEINTTNGVSLQMFSTQAAANGLAYKNGSFFYNWGSGLYEISTGQTNAVLRANLGGSGANANATIFNNEYLFVSNSTTLSRIDLGSFSRTSSSVSGLLTGFGDIASDSSGMVFSSTGTGRIQTFSMSNLGAGATTLSAPAALSGGLQLAFDANGVLFGINTFDSTMYTINTATGVRTQLLNANGSARRVTFNGSNLGISDAASATPVPEPATLVCFVIGVGALSRWKKKAR